MEMNSEMWHFAGSDRWCLWESDWLPSVCLMDWLPFCWAKIYRFYSFSSSEWPPEGDCADSPFFTLLSNCPPTVQLFNLICSISFSRKKQKQLQKKNPAISISSLNLCYRSKIRQVSQWAEQKSEMYNQQSFKSEAAVASFAGNW